MLQTNHGRVTKYFVTCLVDVFRNPPEDLDGIFWIHNGFFFALLLRVFILEAIV